MVKNGEGGGYEEGGQRFFFFFFGDLLPFFLMRAEGRSEANISSS